jgi:hypothetical protein
MVNRGSSKNVELIKNKKGIFFTSIALVVLTLFFISFTLYSQFNERDSIQKRIETMNNFLFSVEQDLPRQIHTSGFRIIFLFEKRIIEKGDYITNVTQSFEEAFFYGTIEGTTNEEIQILMEGVTFSEIENTLNERANKINSDLTLNFPKIQITQEDPWNVKVTLQTNLSLQDKSNLASWNRTTTITSLIPIEGFEDPTYPIENNNPTIISKINRTIYPVDPFSIANLILHAENTYYTNNTDAPSFIDRMEGNLTSKNPYGIESLAVPKLVSIPGRSIVDHKYFTFQPGSSPSCMPSYFIIDSDTEHDIYEVC